MFETQETEWFQVSLRRRKLRPTFLPRSVSTMSLELASLVNEGGDAHDQADDQSQLSEAPIHSNVIDPKISLVTERCFLSILVPVLLITLILITALVPTFVPINWTRPTAVAAPPQIAFCGNSMTYYNDCPRLVEILLQTTFATANESSRLQDSCLRGGGDLQELWQEGSNMEHVFLGTNDTGAQSVESLILRPLGGDDGMVWNYVVLQDELFHVSDTRFRESSIHVLHDHYIPTLLKATTTTKPTILLLEQFPSHNARIRGKIGRFGDFGGFMAAIHNGYETYGTLLQSAGFETKLVPVVQAANYLRDKNPELFIRLYSVDEFHPSPHGTLLQALLIMISMGVPPPRKWTNIHRDLWRARARFWQSDQPYLPLPSDEEAAELRSVARRFMPSNK